MNGRSEPYGHEPRRALARSIGRRGTTLPSGRRICWFAKSQSFAACSMEVKGRNQIIERDALSLIARLSAEGRRCRGRHFQPTWRSVWLLPGNAAIQLVEATNASPFAWGTAG